MPFQNCVSLRAFPQALKPHRFYGLYAGDKSPASLHSELSRSLQSPLFSSRPWQD